ncbi:hypothetical protein GCM10010507_06780 [Streptomyces cinnamoneus]|uniref:HTH merR-type domain-containing protein n=1 Tax=Streptomyces cinnamoneus TaxID=53446 RepID=A0A918T9N1_STRCJ|nr:hypothetical protein GCM10010507_06780 [Streptomyces cinnamoneus]
MSEADRAESGPPEAGRPSNADPPEAGRPSEADLAPAAGRLPPAEYRIEDLAHRSGATVRTIRAYQDRGLLPRPERRGRANVYGDAHLARLRQVSGLLDRGYTLASIKELLDAWDTGRGLGGVLGLAVEVDGPWTDEEPGRITRAELDARFGGERNDRAVEEAVELGVLVRLPSSPDAFLVPSPQELAVAAELHAAGVPLTAISGHLRELRTQVEHIAGRFLDFTAEHVFHPYLGHPPTDEEAAQAAALVRRLRPLAQQTVDAELARAMHTLATRHLRDHLTQPLPAAAAGGPGVGGSGGLGVGPSGGPDARPGGGPGDGPSGSPDAHPGDGPGEGPAAGCDDCTGGGTNADPGAGPDDGPDREPDVGLFDGPDAEPSMGPADGPGAEPSMVPADGPDAEPDAGPDDCPGESPATGGTDDRPHEGPGGGPVLGSTDAPDADAIAGPFAAPGGFPGTGPGAATGPSAAAAEEVRLPAAAVRAVRELVGPENVAAFIAAAAEREVRARVMDGLLPPGEP